MCFSFNCIADRHFYKLCQAGVFPKFGVTLPLSVTASSSLGNSWSIQCSVNLDTSSVQQLFKHIYSLTLDCILFYASTVCFTLNVTCTQLARVLGVVEHLLLLLKWIYMKWSNLYE